MIERERLAIEIAGLRYAQIREEIRKHEDRQTQAFNFALLVYAAELTAASVAAGKILDNAATKNICLADLISLFLPLFQIVFPALIFPLAMLFVDVSIFNQIAHRQARIHLRDTVDTI